MQRTVGKEFATFLTQAGKDIMGRVLRGEITLSFDKCKVGSGLWPVVRNDVDGVIDFTIDVPEQLLSPIADGVFDIDSLVGRSSGVTQATVNIPPTFGPATINEAAWLLEDGTVYAITRYAALPVMPPESGGSSEVSLRAFLNVGDVESVTLVVDSAINASREFVELSLRAFEDKLPVEASTETKGIVQLSSALDSDSEEEAATSKAVKDSLIAHIGNSFINQLTESGYQKLPNGLIIQWGISAGPSGNYTTVFPITFPNASLMVILQGIASQASGNYSVQHVKGSTASIFTMYKQASQTVYWMALGY